MKKKKPKLFNSISVVSSFYNEEKNVDILWNQLKEVDKLITINQFIFVDNGSKDLLYSITKNKIFGCKNFDIKNDYPSTYSKGFSTALRYSTSDYSLIIHSDLQVNIKITIENGLRKLINQKISDKRFCFFDI